jgi:hypothetical protein
VIVDARGFLVLILEDVGEAGLARAALREAGFAEEGLRVYSGEEILADHDRFMAGRGACDEAAGPGRDDRGTVEQYFGYAGEGRAALWVRVADRADATDALRYLTDQRVLDLRYYGYYSQEDIHLP